MIFTLHESAESMNILEEIKICFTNFLICLCSLNFSLFCYLCPHRFSGNTHTHTHTQNTYLNTYSFMHLVIFNFLSNSSVHGAPNGRVIVALRKGNYMEGSDRTLFHVQFRNMNGGAEDDREDSRSRSQVFNWNFPIKTWKIYPPILRIFKPKKFMYHIYQHWRRSIYQGFMLLLLFS